MDSSSVWDDLITGLNKASEEPNIGNILPNTTNFEPREGSTNFGCFVDASMFEDQTWARSCDVYLFTYQRMDLERVGEYGKVPLVVETAMSTPGVHFKYGRLWRRHPEKPSKWQDVTDELMMTPKDIEQSIIDQEISEKTPGNI